MNNLDFLRAYLPDYIYSSIQNMDLQYKNSITEIRIRRNFPLIINLFEKCYFVSLDGKLYREKTDNLIVVNNDDFDTIFMSMCDYTLYSNTENLKRGYITLSNGARVGVCSTGVSDKLGINSIKNVSSLNIRISRQVLGASKDIVETIFNSDLHSTIIVGKPAFGKTTVLRDLALNLSSSKYGLHKVVMIDERNELAGKVGDNFTLNLGDNCDVITSFSKHKAIEIAIRTMSPELIVCDEISTIEELESIKFGFSSGVKFIISIHANGIEDLRNKPIMKEIIDLKEFEYIVLLKENYQKEVIKIDEVMYEDNWRPIYDSFINFN